MYLTYEEYQNMGGTLTETAFNDFEFQARAQVDWYTFNRLQNEDTYGEAVKRCIYHLISVLQSKASASLPGSDSNDGTVVAGVASQSNDGVSISYNVLSASEAVKVAKEEIKETIEMYLQGVMNSLGQKVLYRGVYPNE